MPPTLAAILFGAAVSSACMLLTPGLLRAFTASLLLDIGILLAVTYLGS